MTKYNNQDLIANKAASDPRIVEHKDALVKLLNEYKQSITGPRPPNHALKEKYAELLSVFGAQRGNPLFYPYIGSGIGNGSLVELADGSVKYDFISGIGVHYFGHTDLDVVLSSLDAAMCDTVMQGNLQQNIDSIELVTLLLESSGLDHCFLCSSGAMANENALKLVFQKKFPANRVLAFERNFLGRTIALSQITDKPAFREGLPLNLHVDYVPYFDPENPTDSTFNAVSILKKHLARHPKQHAVMIFELIQGEAGAFAGSREFFVELMTVLKEHDIAIFDDEVQTFGRTHELFAFQHFNLKEYIDVVSIGKLAQICGTLFTKKYSPKAGLLSQTFTASTSAIHAGHTIITKLRNSDLYGLQGKNALMHAYFEKKLTTIADNHPGLIKGPYGLGAMVAFTPFEGDHNKVTEFAHRLYHAGVMSFTAGSNPTRIRFLIPTPVITYEDIDKVCEIIHKLLLETNNV
jgi:4-aminobutyrate aminotransferase-like enzyme